MNNKFDKGDLVAHIASGRRAIVLGLVQRCTVHNVELASIHVDERSCEHHRDECRHVFSGKYLVEADFKSRYIVEENMLREEVS